MDRVRYVGMVREPVRQCRSHTHELWEIVCYTHGCGVTHIGGQTLPFRAGDVFVIPPRVPHDDRADGGFCNIHLLFEDEAFPFCRPVFLPDDADGDIRTVMQMLHRAYHRGGQQPLTESLFDVLCGYLTVLADEPVRDRYVAFFLREMWEHLSDPGYAPRETIAQIPLCADRFRQRFRQETGQTPQQFLRAARIRQAKRLLRLRARSGLTVGEIARLCGFADSLYFSRVFRQETGVAPKDWK